MAAGDWQPRLRRLQKWVVDNFLPLAFAVAIVWAMAWPAPGKAVIEVTILNGEVHLIQEINIIIVFFISGLVLKTEDLKAALRHKLGVAYGLISILFVTPCLGYALRAIPLQPPEFAAGLTLFALVPTTLGVGVSLVRTARATRGWRCCSQVRLPHTADVDTLLDLPGSGGIGTRVASNILGIFTMPIWCLALFKGSGLDVHVDIPDLLAKLVITIMVPSVVGKALRELPPLNRRVKRFTADWKTVLSLFSVFNLAMIVWQSLSGARAALVEQQFVQILYVILLAIGQHLAYLAFNFPVLKYVFKMPLVERIATGVMSSQKSAPVAVTVISYLSSNISQQGLLIIPCVVGQIAQIFIGSALAKYFARQVKRQQSLPAASAPAALELQREASVGGKSLSTKPSSKALPSETEFDGSGTPTADTEADVEAAPAAEAAGADAAAAVESVVQQA